MKQTRLQIYGRVQGVFYRASTQKKARQLDLTGWVRNREDGSVEALVEGEADDVDAMIEWAAHGPENARVEQVKVESLDERLTQRTFEGFEIRR